MAYFPFVLSTLADTLVALDRISEFLVSEDLPESYVTDESLPVAVQVDGDFVWETVLAAGEGEKGKFVHETDKDKKPLKKETSLPMTTSDLEKENVQDEAEARKKGQETPFELKNLKMSVPKGAFVGIMGRVGSGKVSFFDFGIWELTFELSFSWSEFGVTGTNGRNAPNERECKSLVLSCCVITCLNMAFPGCPR